MKPVTFELSISTFKEILSGVGKSIQKDGFKPQFGCVLIEISLNKIRFVSTEGHILLIQDVNANTENFTKDFKVLLVYSKKIAFEKNPPLQDIKFESKKGNILFSVTEKECSFVIQSKKYVSKNVLKDYGFPDYKSVLPFNPYYFTINNEKLSGAVDRAMLYSNETTHLIRFYIKGNELTVKAANEHTGAEMEEFYKVEVLNPPKNEFAFGVNAKMMKTVAGLLEDCDELKVSYAGSERALISSCDSGIDRYILFMPVMTKEKEIEAFDDLSKPENPREEIEADFIIKHINTILLALKEIGVFSMLDVFQLGISKDGMILTNSDSQNWIKAQIPGKFKKDFCKVLEYDKLLIFLEDQKNNSDKFKIIEFTNEVEIVVDDAFVILEANDCTEDSDYSYLLNPPVYDRNASNRIGQVDVDSFAEALGDLPINHSSFLGIEDKDKKYKYKAIVCETKGYMYNLEIDEIEKILSICKKTKVFNVDAHSSKYLQISYLINGVLFEVFIQNSVGYVDSVIDVESAKKSEKTLVLEDFLSDASKSKTLHENTPKPEKQPVKQPKTPAKDFSKILSSIKENIEAIKYDEKKRAKLIDDLVSLQYQIGLYEKNTEEYKKLKKQISIVEQGIEKIEKTTRINYEKGIEKPLDLQKFGYIATDVLDFYDLYKWKDTHEALKEILEKGTDDKFKQGLEEDAQKLLEDSGYKTPPETEPKTPTKQNTQNIIKGLEIALRHADKAEKASLRNIIKGLKIALKYS